MLTAKDHGSSGRKDSNTFGGYSVKVLSLFMTFFMSLPVWAQSSTEQRLVLVGGEEQVEQTTTETYGDQGESLINAQGYQVTQGAGGFANAGSTSSQGGSVQMLGMIMGAGFMRVCGTPGGQWACAAAALSFATAMAGGQSKGDGQYTAAHLETGGNIDGVGQGGDVYQDQAAAGLNTLSGLGYTVNADGSVSTPNGTKVTSSDYASVQALMAKGMPAGMAAQAVQGVSDVQKAAAASTGLAPEQLVGQNGNGSSSGSGDVDSSGGGGGQAMGDIVIEEIEYRDRNKGKDNRMPASQAAQLSKNFNGTPIGIGMADIFLIVQRKYEEKRNNKSPEFITGEY